MSSFFRRQFAAIRAVLVGVPAADRDAAAEAIGAQLTRSNPGQRVVVMGAIDAAMASVTPKTFSHELLDAAVAGVTPRGDLLILRRDALLQRDASGLLAIDDALRDLTKRARAQAKGDALASRLIAFEMSRRAESRRRQRAEDDRRSKNWGGLL